MTEPTAGAELSDCERYRYRLSRTWGIGERMAWVMLNPSTADASVDDPTIRRCMSFARREGYNGIEVVNLFAYRSPNPSDLYDSAAAGIDVVGPDNHRHWDAVLSDHGIGMVVAAWGANIFARLAKSPLQEWFTGGWFCLGTTKIGAPRHPLYVKSDAEFVPFHSVRACRVCGCTDDNACQPPCSWVAADLCSACGGAS